MKKIISILIGLALVITLVIYIQDSRNYVSIEGDSFYLNGDPFKVVCVNYKTIIREKDGEFWASRFPGYEKENKFSTHDRASSLKELEKDFQMIADMGFNTIRLKGLTLPVVTQQKTDPRVKMRAYSDNWTITEYDLSDETQWLKWEQCVREVLDIANKKNLKLILGHNMLPNIPKLDRILYHMVKEFGDRPEIMAWDLLNEPLYFDSVPHSKEEVYFATLKWNEIVKSNSNHLTTMGLASQREVFVWDPNLVQVDFISFHPYEFEPDQVRGEVYWYQKFVNKPWIIGETGIPADNDSVPYLDQVEFAKKTYAQTFRCGGLGYSWWQFKDDHWGDFQQRYLGLLSHDDSTTLSNGEQIAGSLKNLGKELKNIISDYSAGPCLCPDNYYNFGSHSYFSIKGKVVDLEGNPIEGAGILAWNETFIDHHFTTTKADGTFELFSEYKFYHWMVSALEYEQGYYKNNHANVIQVGNTLTENVGTKKLREVTYSPWIRFFRRFSSKRYDGQKK